MVGTPALQGTLRITPVIDGNCALVEWWANFDCEPARRDELSETLQGWFVKWLQSLRESTASQLAKSPAGADLVAR
jgi:hypothetical protein